MGASHSITVTLRKEGQEKLQGKTPNKLSAEVMLPFAPEGVNTYFPNKTVNIQSRISRIWPAWQDRICERRLRSIAPTSISVVARVPPATFHCAADTTAATAVIPSEVEESRGVHELVTPRDPSTPRSLP